MSDAPRVAGLVLAAGQGARFGAVKQLADFRGRPLIAWSVGAVAEAGLAPVVVVLGAHAARIEAEAGLSGVELVTAADWAQGQSASLRAGLRAAADAGADAAVIVLGDQPLIEAAAVRRVVDAWSGEPVVRATYGGAPGHPTLLARGVWDRLLALRGDQGARAVFGEVGVATVACDGLGSPADADTPAALARLAATAPPRPPRA